MNILTEYLADRFQDATPFFFYRSIFPEGELEKSGEYVSGKYNGIIVAVTKEKKSDGKTKVKRYTLTDDLGALRFATESDDFCLCSPLSYAGKNRTSENARMLYAIAVDVDRIKKDDAEPVGLRDLLHQMETVNSNTGEKYLPRPTFIVSSGTGIHLYYVLEKPVPLYRDNAVELQELKRELTRLIWNDYVVDIKNAREIQQEGIFQGFRMPGTITKNGSRAAAFKTGEKVTIEYLNRFVSAEHKAKNVATMQKKQGLSLDEAREKYPEWYERRIEQQEPRGVWHNSRNLYDWWKRKIYEGATVGHRYYCIMMLAIYAKKCSCFDIKHNPFPVTQEELERDAYSLIEFMDKKTEDENNHFSAADVQDALEAFQDRWTTYPREAIEYRTGIAVPANKRNYRKQVTHLKIARNTLDILNEENGRALQGRKSLESEVRQWRSEHPNGTKSACIKETGLSKPTVYKHWDEKGPAQLLSNPAQNDKTKKEENHIVAGMRRLISYTMKESPEDAMEILEAFMDEFQSNLNKERGKNAALVEEALVKMGDMHRTMAKQKTLRKKNKEV